MKSLETWASEHADELQADMAKAADDAALISSDAAAQVEEHIIDGIDRDVFLLAIHAYSAGYLRGYENEVDER